MKLTRTWLTDVTERVGATFGEAFLAVFGINGLVALAGGNWHTVRTLAQAAAVAGGGAALAFIKGLLAKKRQGTISPASLVKP